MSARLDGVAAIDPRARELEWVESARHGDATAFRRIVEAHHRPLYIMAARLIGDSTEAQDLVQESLAKAYVHLDRYDPSYRLSTWLHRITLNTCRDFLKCSRRRERPADGVGLESTEDESRGPEACFVERRRAERLRAALDSLKPSYREVLVLKDLQEMSYEEMKAVTGSPITALKIRVVRARAKLRRALELDSLHEELQ